MSRSKWMVALAILTSMALLTGGSVALAGKRGVPNGKGLGVEGAPGQQTADEGSSEPQPPVDYSETQGLSQPIYTTERKSYEVPAHDGINLYVEVEMPKNAPAGSRFPVIFEASPYHGVNATRIGDRILPYPKVSNASIGLSGYFAPRGYAVAFMNLRGTGRSEGCLDHLAGNDAKDLETVIEWLADQPWSNGRIGMAGHSYVGATQVVAAAQNPRGLVTIVPSAGLAGMYDHQFQMGVPYFLQYAGPQWSYEGIAMARHLPAPLSPATGVLFGNAGDNFGNDMQYFGCGWQNSAFTAGHGQVTGMGQAWHAARDWRMGAAAWKGDVFMVHGVNDNAARIPAAEWFFKYRDSADHPGDKVWLGQWDHTSSQMNFRRMQWTLALHAWFDNKLMQRTWTDANGVQHEVDTGPPVEVFVNDVQGGGGSSTAIGEFQHTYTASSWPGPQESLTLYPVAGDNSLAATAPATSGTKAYTSAAVNAGPNAAVQPAGTFVEFTSAPLAEDTLLVGPPPELKLHASVTGQRLNIITTLYAENEGTRRAINYCAMNAELRNGIYSSSPIIPGEEMRLEPQCFTIGGLVRAGEQLVLRVGAASPHHLGTWTVDPQVTIYTGPGKSSLTLPAVTDPVLFPDVLAEG
jgi:putative CocE/NonD family hydrolase